MKSQCLIVAAVVASLLIVVCSNTIFAAAASSPPRPTYSLPFHYISTSLIPSQGTSTKTETWANADGSKGLKNISSLQGWYTILLRNDQKSFYYIYPFNGTVLCSAYYLGKTVPINPPEIGANLRFVSQMPYNERLVNVWRAIVFARNYVTAYTYADDVNQQQQPLAASFNDDSMLGSNFWTTFQQGKSYPGPDDSLFDLPSACKIPPHDDVTRRFLFKNEHHEEHFADLMFFPSLHSASEAAKKGRVTAHDINPTYINHLLDNNHQTHAIVRHHLNKKKKQQKEQHDHFYLDDIPQEAFLDILHATTPSDLKIQQKYNKKQQHHQQSSSTGENVHFQPSRAGEVVDNSVYATPVGDQSVSCGSCHGWSTAAASEIVSNKKIGRQSAGPFNALSFDYSFSVQYILDCVHYSVKNTSAHPASSALPIPLSQGCLGGNIVDDATRIIEHGIPHAVDYVYQAANGAKCRADEMPEMYFPLSKIEVAINDTAAVLEAVRKYGAVVAIISVPPDFVFFSGGGVYDDESCPAGLAHAVTIMGYSYDRKGRLIFKAKNSFGRGWGSSIKEAGSGGYFEMLSTVCGISQYGIIFIP